MPTAEQPETGQPDTGIPLRDAATVVLVRDSPNGIEVFLQRRVKQMAFAGGMTVFPGGGVDPRDADASLDWTGPQPQWWAGQFATDPDVAQALVCAAVRETFEECGVLLATDADGVFADPAALGDDRTRLVDKSTSFAEFLRTRGLTLRADLLAPLAHWITPKNEKRRYDTRFFLASMPDGQEADDDTTEAEVAQWMTAAQALDLWTSGKHFLLPPTWSQLDEISRHRTVAELMAVTRSITPIEPEVSVGAGLRGLFFPDAERYFAGLGEHAIPDITR